jgi:hypothetical protein
VIVGAGEDKTIGKICDAASVEPIVVDAAANAAAKKVTEALAIAPIHDFPEFAR